MKDVEEWLLAKGRLIPDALSFVDQLCAKINQAGIPVDRVRIGFKTIHPQMDVWAYYWTKSEGKAYLWGGEHGIRTSSSYYGSPAEWVHLNHATFRRKLDSLDPKKDHQLLFEQADLGFTDYIMLPLDFSDGSAAIIAYATAFDSGFSDQNIQDLERLIGFIGPIIEVHATRKIAITLLDTYIGHRSGERIMHGQIQRGDGEKIEAALWFSDLRNYTGLSEQYRQDVVFDLLNDYFQTISDVVGNHGGEILKFIGDAVLVIFPVDTDIGASTACNAALQAAREGFELFEEQNQTRLAQQKPLIKFGIGLNFGDVVFGNVGALDRLDFTVMGPAVNLTARLEELTKTADCPLLLSEEFARHADIKAESLGDFSFKGIRGQHEVFCVAETNFSSLQHRKIKRSSLE